MKIIDNRYKIENIIYNNIYFEFYKVIDLWGDDKVKFMKIYHCDNENNLIKHHIEHFIGLANIKHENILASEKFNAVKTIDTKKTNMLLYYSISEYTDYPTLEQINKKLNLQQRLEILIQIILALDFLHFRGIVYKLLNPSQIYISNKNKVKIQSLSTIMEKVFNSRYTEFERKFMSPEFTMDNVKEDNRIDYYSLGNLIEYLFAEEESLAQEELKLFKDIIKDLTRKDYTNNKVDLIQILNKIIDSFELDYTYDLTKHRDILFFNNKIVGREKASLKMMEIDQAIYDRTNIYKGLLIKGDFGIGKSRFLGELSYTLRMSGRDVYSTRISETDSNGLLDISNILKQSIQDTPNNLIDKYRKELCKILPELSLELEEEFQLNLNLKTEKYRIYNRIANYFKELSKDRIIYIIIDDIQNSNNNFLELLHYLLNDIENSNIFFIISYEENSEINTNITKKIQKWISDSTLTDIKLHNLDLEEMGEVIKNILGMGTVPINFSSVLFRETNGNPRHIESLVKHLYDIGQLYMNEKGRWHLTVDDFSELYIPANIDETMLRQLNVIKDKYYEVFKVMSIFDDFLHKTMLLKMLDIESQKLESQLEELIRLKLIDEKLVDWGYSYSINNIELKKLIYFQLPKEEKIILHKGAVEAILALQKDDIEFIFAELIYHLIKSEQSDKAIDIILKKIETIDNIYGAQGIYLLEKAYRIIGDKDNIIKLEILEKLTNVYFAIGKLEDTKVYLEEYEILSERLKEYKHLIKAKTTFVNIYYIKIQLDLYMKKIEEIEQIAHENNIIEGKIVGLSLKARLNIQKGELDEAEKQLVQCVELSEKHGIYDHKGAIYNRLGIIKAYEFDIKNAVKYYEKSICFYNEEGNFIDATRPINNIGNIYMSYYGDNEKAIEHYKKGLDIASRYNIKEIEMVFLHNLSSVCSVNYEYDMALKYALKAKKNAIDLQDLNSIFVSHTDLGRIYLYTGKYDKAYDNYRYVKEIFESKNIENFQSASSYHDFMMEFYMSFGQLDKATEHCIIKNNIYEKTNEKEYLEFQYKLQLIKYLKDRDFNKNEINNIISQYKNTLYFQDAREVILIFAGISLFEGDIEYTFKLLEEDKKIKGKAKNEFLNKIRDSIIYYLNPLEENESIDRLASMEKYFEYNYKLPMKLLINLGIGFKLSSKNKHKSSIKYFIEALDIIYREMLRIPDLNLRFSFIESRQTDFIKLTLIRAIKRGYGETLEYIKLKDITTDRLNDYFDITPIIDILGNDEFSKITQLDSYGEAVNIASVEELIASLTQDYKYNLELIIKYISKETIASKGYILKYDKSTQKNIIVSSLDGKTDCEINENILKLSNRKKEGLLINNDMLNIRGQEYQELLSDDTRGIICVPILINIEDVNHTNDRRKRFKKENHNIGYIYLETDKVFNRFNKGKLRDILNLTYLTYINLENNRLKVEATTDKLTEVYTRKYYEKLCLELVNDTKSNKGSFSLLILDIDGFKNINDTYGHRKGDEVLQEMGRTLKSIVRSTDIVARYGGEEFVILLKDTGKEEAENIAEKIRKAIYSLKIKGVNTTITISIGISIFPLHSQFKEELIEKADQALYYAKETGKNKVCFWDYSMTDSYNRTDKLAGILTGNTESDNRNILAMLDIMELIKEKRDLEDKICEFLGNMLNVIEAEQITLIVHNKEKPKYYTRVRFNEDLVDTPLLNKSIIHRVMKNKKGEFLIDWDNLNNVDYISGLPNWESVMVLPLVKGGSLKGVIYLSAPLKTKEFDFNSYNLSRCITNIFAAIL